MANPYVGQLGAVGIAKETTRYTFENPTRFIPVHLPCDLGSPEINLLLSKGIREIPDAYYKAAQGARALKNGKMTFEVEPENCVGILNAAFGTDTVTGPTDTAAYTHTFSRLASAQLPPYSIWVNNGLNQPSFTGCMLSKLDLDIKAPEFVIADATWAGQWNGADTTHTVSYSTLDPFKFSEAVLTVGGSSVKLYKNCKLSIDNMVSIDPLIGGTVDANVIYSKGFAVSLSATIVVEDSTEWAKFIAGTSTSFVIALTSAQTITGAATTKYSLTFNLPNLYYDKAPLALANGLIEIPFEARAIYDKSTTKTLNAVLVNGLSAVE